VHRAAIACLVLVCVPLAGCMGGSEPPDGSDEAAPGGAGEEALASLAAPNWSVGDYWTWSSPQVGEVTYVVTGDAGSDWIVDTTNEEVAFFDARFPVSTLGEIRKSDLAGSQGEERVRFFEWPLEVNETWTTTWDGVEREITVEAIEGSRAELVARQEGRVAVEYTYDSERGSFGELAYKDANGTETFAMQPGDHGNGPPEPAVRWQLANPVDEEGTFGAEPASFGFGFDVPENATDIWLDFAIACPGNGAYDFGFGPSGDGQTDEGSSYGASASCPSEANVTGVVVEDPTPGEYRGGLTASSADAEGRYAITLYVRTLQEVPVGES